MGGGRQDTSALVRRLPDDDAPRQLGIRDLPVRTERSEVRSRRALAFDFARREQLLVAC